MKVRDFLTAIEEIYRKDGLILDKEICCFDNKTNKSYSTPTKPTVVDWSDEKYLDIVFNYEELNNDLGRINRKS